MTANKEALVLTPDERPLELVSPARDGMCAEMDKAMKAALRGDFTELNRIEIDHLNLLVRIGDFRIRAADGSAHWWFDPLDARHARLESSGQAPFIVAILRGYDAMARSALQWALCEKCRRCDGKLRRLPCRVCDGRWYLQKGDQAVIHTDLDGVLIEERT